MTTPDSTPEAAPQHTPGAMERFARERGYKAEDDTVIFDAADFFGEAREQDAIKADLMAALEDAAAHMHSLAERMPLGADRNALTMRIAEACAAIARARGGQQ